MTTPNTVPDPLLREIAAGADPIDMDDLLANATFLAVVNRAYVAGQATRDIATRDRIAADALRWAAGRVDPGPRATRAKPTDETHDATMCADRGTATNLRFWADQIERGYIEPRPAGSGPHVTNPEKADIEPVAVSVNGNGAQP